MKPGQRTSFSRLANKVLNGAPVCDLHILLLDGAAAIVKAFGLVHGLLQGIALPAEHVVGVGPVAGGASLEAPNEGVGSTRRPQAVELGGVPYGLERHLWYADRVGCGAFRCVGETLGSDCVVHVILVVG